MEYYTIPEIISLIGKSQSFIYRNIKRGKLDAFKKNIGGKDVMIVEAEALKKFLSDGFGDALEILTGRENQKEAGRSFDEQEEALTSLEKPKEALTIGEIEKAVMRVLEAKEYQVMRPIEDFFNGQARLLQNENSSLREQLKELQIKAKEDEKLREADKKEIEELRGKIGELRGEIERVKALSWWEKLRGKE